MQIKFSYKMAKNDGPTAFCANTVQENERMLQEFCRKSLVETKSKEDFDKLFDKLNYICQIKSAKEDVQLNSSWSNKSVVNYTYGSILGFPSGSWWGIRMDCSRDRVHDPFDENIQNGPFGVTSICTSSINVNEDVDFGNFLTLTGQKYVNGKSDKDPLVKNYENQIPVRLIRSYNLLNEFAPKTGYRYDGLYIVNNFWIGVNSGSTKYYKFALLRLSYQEPPSWNMKQCPSSTSKSVSAVNSVSASIKNSSENSSPSVYAFRKYSHVSEAAVQRVKHEKSDGFLQLSSFENKRMDEKEKVSPESSIVTRHVFKKTSSNAEHAPSIASTSVASDNKSLSHIGTQGSKTHNTNISIRTGLYDSSHSTQHDVKKTTLSPFCRTAKPVNLLKPNQLVENLSLCGKDKSRNVDGKMQTSTTNEVPKRMDYISPNTVKPDSLKIKPAKDTNKQLNGTNLSSCYKHEYNYGRTYKSNDSKDICKSNDDSSDATGNLLNLTNSVYRNETVHKTVSKEAQELKSLDSLDSLTPDKILHLINKKCHPLSKLLMGNMIGLTSEQSTALKTGDSQTVQSDIKDKIAQTDSLDETKERKNFDAIPDDLLAGRSYKFRRRRMLSRRIMNMSEIRKCSKTYNGKLQKGTVQSSDILGPNSVVLDARNDSRKTAKDLRNGVQERETNSLQQSTKAIKKNVGNKSEVRTRLRTMKTIKSSMKKHMNKKQRREIANLLIDAKIGPKIRGPRNRRLRRINNVYAKQSYEPFSTAICTLNKCQISPDISAQRSNFKSRNKLKISGYKRVRDKQSSSAERSEPMNMRQNGMHKNLTVSTKLDKDHIAEGIVSGKGDNNKKSKSIEKISVQAKSTTVESRKRKPMQTVSTALKCSRIEIKSRYDHTKEISKACKSDAVTQCSLIKEPLMRNLKLNAFPQTHKRNEQYTFIKMEYGDVKDMKSEVLHEASRSEDENKNHRTYRSDEKAKYCTKSTCSIQRPKNSNFSLNSNVTSAKKYSGAQEPERVSAFVPVNVADNDLKIARLRSIGFKPIMCSSSDEDISNQNNGSSSTTFNSKVVKKNVAEKYNQYTNEENDVVVYMDDELQYQDIEDEDKNALSNRRKASDSRVGASVHEQLNRVTSDNKSYNDLLLEQDLESPWHGWKKVVTNADTYWVGW